MKNEIVLAFNEVLEDKGLPKDIILDALKSALVSAYRKSLNASNAQQIIADIQLENGTLQIFAEKEVVDSVQDDRTEVILKTARKYDPDAEFGDMVLVESTPENFGRVAAQTARQVIQQKIREAERNLQVDYYSKQLGEIISGVVQAAGSHGLTIGLELKAEGMMPRKEMIPYERFRIHDRIRALVAEVKDTPRGPQIILSRTHRDFLRRLLENEVPEIFHGVVEIRAIAREPGQRAKVAVSTNQHGIDPVGACVGQRGVRIQAIVRELHDEKIDVIEWNKDSRAYIAKAISPARVNGVYLNNSSENGKTALVVVPEDQLSLAIGRNGQNARLAARLTNWRIDIKSLTEAVSDWLFALKNNEEHKEQAKQYQEKIVEIEDIMARKAEGRVLSLNEYDVLAKFVDSLEGSLFDVRQEEKQVYETTLAEIKNTIPLIAYDTQIPEAEFTSKVLASLSAGGINNLGDLAIKVKMDPDSITELDGIGPKTLKSIEELASNISDYLPEVIKEEEIVEVIEDKIEESVEDIPVDQGIEEQEILEVEKEVIQPDSIAEEAEETEKEEEVGEAEKTEESKVETEDELSFEEMFKLEAQDFNKKDIPDEDSDESLDSKDDKKKKKKKYQEIEYDPDLDVTIVRKKRKRSDDDWDWEKE